VAIETADVVLMRSDPLDVPTALQIGRGTLHKMRQNLGWAIGYLALVRLAAGDEIIAIPTLVRKLPTPVRKIIGDLSNSERVLVGLQLRPHGREGTRAGDALRRNGETRR